MPSFHIKQTVFRGMLRATPAAVDAAVLPAFERELSSALQLYRKSEKATFYSVVGQSRADLDDPTNSPSISMWPYLLASTQSKRLNEISIYAERGTSPSELRYLYFNDVALALWSEMGKHVSVLGRLHRPPRSATLSFGAPFSE